MGFKLVRKGYSLKFADGSELDGATIVMSGMSVGQIMKARAAMRTVKSGEDDGAKADSILEVVNTVTGNLVSWDLEEEDGTPIPANAEGVQSLELDTVFTLFNAWLEAVQGVDAPLPDASSDGEKPMLEASIPMEALPTSQAS